jgi:RimJ/RimL family protein N-acetyltransferase
MIEGTLINLRPVTRADLPTMATWVNNIDFNSEFNFFGLRAAETFEKRYNENGMLGADSGTLLIITKNGEVIGDVGYFMFFYGPGDGNKVPNMGITIHKNYRGKGYGVEAQRLFCQYLFNTFAINRVEASTDVENRAEQRALEKAGFTREGILRGAQFRGGKYHDMVLYSKLRGE